VDAVGRLELPRPGVEHVYRTDRKSAWTVPFWFESAHDDSVMSESAGTAPNDALAAEGTAAGAAATSAPTQARQVRPWSLITPATLGGRRHSRNGGIPELC
jgi:hypothetical protein